MEAVMNLMYIPAYKSTFFGRDFKYKFMFYILLQVLNIFLLLFTQACERYIRCHFDSIKTLRINRIVNQIIHAFYLLRF